MSTSDSDFSIDWLASDEDDCDSPKKPSPQHSVELPTQSSSSSSSSSSLSTTSLRKPPASSFRSAKRRRSDCCDCRDGGADSPVTLQTPAFGLLQGFTSVCTQQTLSPESKYQSTRERAHSAGSDRLCEKPQPDTGNEQFSHKCMELQCYIQPLSSILRGLRSGRYSQRLSTFQESVAMDRIQRIMGVLQNPNMGGRFVDIILKMEEMLHSWFPHIKPNPPQTGDATPAKRQKQQHHGSSSPPPSSPVSLCSSDVEPSGSFSSTHLKWLRTSPICSLKTPESTLYRPAASASRLPTRCSQEVTQDNAVSSSTDSRAGPRRRLSANTRLSQGPLPFKINSPCLERLLQAKESIIAPRTVGDEGWLSWLPAEDS